MPSEDEILEINRKVANFVLANGGDTEEILKEQAQALAKRIGKEARDE